MWVTLLLLVLAALAILARLILEHPSFGWAGFILSVLFGIGLMPAEWGPTAEVFAGIIAGVVVFFILYVVIGLGELAWADRSSSGLSYDDEM